MSLRDGSGINTKNFRIVTDFCQYNLHRFQRVVPYICFHEYTYLVCRPVLDRFRWHRNLCGALCQKLKGFCNCRQVLAHVGCHRNGFRDLVRLRGRAGYSRHVCQARIYRCDSRSFRIGHVSGSRGTSFCQAALQDESHDDQRLSFRSVLSFLTSGGWLPRSRRWGWYSMSYRVAPFR